MNSVVLIGRLTKDPEVRYTSGSQMAVCNFTLAIDRPTKEEKKTDYPRVTVFGRQAENCERFLTKGRLCGVQGRIQTGSYQDKDGKMVYTTDVVADRVEFLEWGNAQPSEETQPKSTPEPQEAVEETHQETIEEPPQEEPAPEGFAYLNEDVPF